MIRAYLNIISISCLRIIYPKIDVAEKKVIIRSHTKAFKIAVSSGNIALLTFQSFSQNFYQAGIVECLQETRNLFYNLINWGTYEPYVRL